jgi:hypothetical protein
MTLWYAVEGVVTWRGPMKTKNERKCGLQGHSWLMVVVKHKDSILEEKEKVKS